MRKRKKLIWLSLIVPLAMISGCNNEDKAEPPAKAKETNKESSEETTKIRLLEKQLTYSLDGEQNTETAFLKNSDHQPYSLYVLQNFELTAEEPGKDVLFSKQEDRYFMRIEILPAKPDSLIEEVKAALSVVNTEVKQLPSSDSPWLQDASIFQSSSADETVTAYLIPSGDETIKLTIFDNSKQRYNSAFLAMAKTIAVK